MNNPWGVNLKKTGLTEKRLGKDAEEMNKIYAEQGQLQNVSMQNKGKTDVYQQRQADLAADAMYGKQGRYNVGGKSKKYRKTSRKYRKHRKTRRHYKKK